MSMTEAVISEDKIWEQDGVSLIKENGQISEPCGICIDDDNQCIYIVDRGNHRIVRCKLNDETSSVEVVAGGRGEGNQMNQLSRPSHVVFDRERNSLIIADYDNDRVMEWSLDNPTQGQVLHTNIKCWGLAMDKHGSLYVSDCERCEVIRWKRGEKTGTVVAGGNEEGDRLDQLNAPTCLFVDNEDSLYISDMRNSRVMKWVKDAKEGIIVAGGNSESSSLGQLSCPMGLAVDSLGHVYVVDQGNYRIVRWIPGAKEGTIVVCGNGGGEGSNQFNGPVDLSFDRDENLYVSDNTNNRIQKFQIHDVENSTYF